MMGNPAEALRDRIEFEKNLAVGQEVTVRWTWCHGYYKARATVTKLNEKSAKAKIVEATGPYEAGQVITVPRILDMRRWSWDNCLEPIAS
jgi:hypothetical protein